MQILGLLGMFFDAAGVFFTKFSLLLSLALAILWQVRELNYIWYHDDVIRYDTAISFIALIN
jgi:hypothetical protein